MIIWILIVLTLILIGVVWYNTGNVLIETMGFVGGLILFVMWIMVLGFSIELWKNENTIDEKMEYLSQYNQDISKEIMTIVENYQGYEKEMFDNNVNPNVIVATYPELKSSELIVEQIKIYNNNQQSIKSLEFSKIDLEFSRKLWYLWY